MQTAQRQRLTNGANGHRPVIAKRKFKLAPKALRQMERSNLPRELARTLKSTPDKIRRRLKDANLPRTEWKDRKKVLGAIVMAGDIKGARDLYDREFGSSSTNGADVVSSAVPSIAAVAMDTAVLAASAPPPAAEPAEPTPAAEHYAPWSMPKLCKELGVNDATGYNWLKSIGKKARESNRQEVLELALKISRDPSVVRRARRLLAGGGQTEEAEASHAVASPDHLDRKLLILELQRGAHFLDKQMQGGRMRVADLDDAHISLLAAYRMLTVRAK